MDFLHFPKLDDGIYFLIDIVSRKKHLIPIISELLEELKKFQQ